MKISAFVGAAALALTATLGAQTPSTPPAAPQVTPPAGYPALGEKPVITLLSAGTNPRPPFKQLPAPGVTEHMEMTMSMAMAMEIAGMQPPLPAMPPIALTSDITAEEPASNGDVTVSIAFTGATAAGPLPDPAFGAVIQKLNDDMKALKGSITVDKNGRITAQNLAAPGGPNVLGGDPTQAFLDSLKDLTPPWPNGMIGVGGRWELRQAVNAGGILMFQKSTYEVTATDADSITLRVVGEQTSPRQTIDNPALPPGASMTLDESSATTTGTMTVRRDSLVPHSDMTVKTSMRFQMSINGETQPMTLNMEIGMKIRKG